MPFDETAEAFGDTADFGGFFDSVLNVATPKKKVEAKVRADLSAKLTAQGKTPAQVASATSLLGKAQASAKVTPAALGKGMLQTAKIGAALAAFIVPGGAVAGTAALGGLVAADKLVAAGQKGVAAAKSVVSTTKTLAAAGNVEAQRGLQMIGVAADLRAKAGIASGVPSPVNAAGAAAHAAFLAQRSPVVVAPPKPAAAAAPARVVVPPRQPFVAAYVPPRAAVVAPRAVVAPAVYAPASFAPVVRPSAPVQRDWLVHDSGLVQRVVRGQAIAAAGGWLVGARGLQRV